MNQQVVPLCTISPVRVLRYGLCECIKLRKKNEAEVEMFRRRRMHRSRMNGPPLTIISVFILAFSCYFAFGRVRNSDSGLFLKILFSNKVYFLHTTYPYMKNKHKMFIKIR